MKTRETQQKDKLVSQRNNSDEATKQRKQIQELDPNNPLQQKQVDTIANNTEISTQKKKIEAAFSNTLQREVNPEEEELTQKKTMQRQAGLEEEELPAQGKFSRNSIAQMMPEEEEELPAQGKFMNNSTAQMMPEEEEELPGQAKMAPAQKQKNSTGMPDNVKTKMESSFNTDFSNVKVHANSSKAPEVGALAYTQGHDVHFAPGQFTPDSTSGQQLLGHELAHVVQQREGRVQPTTKVAGMPVNDDSSLENEADVLGVKASKQ